VGLDFQAGVDLAVFFPAEFGFAALFPTVALGFGRAGDLFAAMGGSLRLGQRDGRLFAMGGYYRCVTPT